MSCLNLTVDVLLLALAIGAVVDVWLNGSIFAGWRAYAEVWEGKLAELAGCPLCLNYQAAIWLTLGLVILPLALPWWAALVPRTLLIVLATGRLAWLINVRLGPEHGYDRGSQDDGGTQEDH
jgi:hypothetical protein